MVLPNDRWDATSDRPLGLPFSIFAVEGCEQLGIGDVVARNRCRH
ncbi:hypothetical protein ACFYVR_23450 [Rhodococcus sp. NPDC003318]